MLKVMVQMAIRRFSTNALLQLALGFTGQSLDRVIKVRQSDDDVARIREPLAGGRYGGNRARIF